MSNPVYLALDLPHLDAARDLAMKVRAHVGGLKLGLEFFCAHGHHGVLSICTFAHAARASRGPGCAPPGK